MNYSFRNSHIRTQTWAMLSGKIEHLETLIYSYLQLVSFEPRPGTSEPQIHERHSPLLLLSGGTHILLQSESTTS